MMCILIYRRYVLTRAACLNSQSHVAFDSGSITRLFGSNGLQSQEGDFFFQIRWGIYKNSSLIHIGLKAGSGKRAGNRFHSAWGIEDETYVFNLKSRQCRVNTVKSQMRITWDFFCNWTFHLVSMAYKRSLDILHTTVNYVRILATEKNRIILGSPLQHSDQQANGVIIGDLAV